MAEVREDWAKENAEIFHEYMTAVAVAQPLQHAKEIQDKYDIPWRSSPLQHKNDIPIVYAHLDYIQLLDSARIRTQLDILEKELKL